jgi:hypothetical protein
MTKNRLFSWRVHEHTMESLATKARGRKTSVAGLLDEIVQDWLGREQSARGDAGREETVRAAAMTCFGTIRGGNPKRSKQARELIREKLHRRHGAKRAR